MYETSFSVSILSCVFIFPFLPSRWWPVGLKHVIELIRNKQIVVFDQICRDSCYPKQSRDELSLKKKTWFICWSETTLAVWYIVFLELCIVPALWNVQVAFFFFFFPQAFVIIHPVTAAAVISGVIHEMLFGSQCHSSQSAHQPVHRVL
jgi:hypothetical protein